MGEELSATSKDFDFDYEDTRVRIVPITNLQEVKISDITIGPLEEGKEFETSFWIAEEFIKLGYAHFNEEDILTYATLNKLHWREIKLSPGLQVSALPNYFYPKLRRLLNTTRQRANKEPSAASQYLQADRLARDIINCRLRKIVNLAASSTRASSITQALSNEERILFEKVKKAVTDWEKSILENEIK